MTRTNLPSPPAPVGSIALTQVFELEATLDGKRFEYRLELGYADATKEQRVSLERLTVNGESVFELSGGKIRFFPSTSESVAVPLQTNRSALHLSVLSNDDVRRFVEWLNNHVHCFDIDAYPGQMDDAADNEEHEPDFELNNLAGWYRSLLTTYPDVNVRFHDSLKRCMGRILDTPSSRRKRMVGETYERSSPLQPRRE